VLGFQYLELGGDFVNRWAFGKKVWKAENKFKVTNIQTKGTRCGT
jgi:hypothetical protein